MKNPQNLKEFINGYRDKNGPIVDQKMTITGTRKGVTVEQAFAFAFIFSRLQPMLFIQGAAIGADAQLTNAVFLCRLHKSDTFIHAAPSDIPSQVSATAVKQSDTIDRAQPPLQRNKRMVHLGTYLVAFPYENKPQFRGGTWSTIRFAESIRKPLIIVKPDGKLVFSTRSL